MNEMQGDISRGKSRTRLRSRRRGGASSNHSNDRTGRVGGNFIVQGSLLAAAGIIVRVIGMVYRVPLTALIGVEGNGYYTSAFSIYSLLLILSSYSMPTVISRLVSRSLAGGRYRNTERILRAAFLYATIIGLFMFSVLYFGAEIIAEMLKKPYCSFSLQALAPTVWIMAYLGIMRGYFQGTGNMVPTAVSQILEQILNAFVSVIAAGILIRQGERANILYGETGYPPAFGAAGGCLGTLAGAFIALLFFAILYSMHRPLLHFRARRDKNPKESYRKIMMLLGATMLPILISSTVYNVSSVIDDYIFGNVMAKLGNASRIVTEWGVFGEYHILFNIPVALSNALSSSLIPSLTRAVEERNRRETAVFIRYSVRFTMMIAIPASIGLAVLAEPICTMLFPGNSVELLVNLTRIGAMAVIFYSQSTISNAVLQGLGRLHIPLCNAFLALIIHIGALLEFLYLGLGIYGVVLANMVFALIICVLNQMSIRKYTHVALDLAHCYLYPSIAGGFMGASAYLIYSLVKLILPSHLHDGRIGATILTIPSICIAVFVYFAAMILMRAFSEEDLEHMPFGRHLRRFVR